MTVLRSIHVRHDCRHASEFEEVAAVADLFFEELQKPACVAGIAAANQSGRSSADVQACFLPIAQGLGFHSEKQGLFRDYESALRPDYYLPIGTTGILLEVERGKTTANNMDMLDFWKCHLCSHASHLFLLVPQALQHNAAMKPVNQFLVVERRLKWFFQNPKNYTNVKSLFLFGY